MDVALILADAARVHPDNTFSLLRGGITVVNVRRNAPIVFKGALLVRVAGTPSEAGTHEVRIVCIGEDGGQIGQEIADSFEIHAEGGSVQVVLDMDITLPRHGRYEFAVTVDGDRTVRWPLEMREVTRDRGNATASGESVARLELAVPAVGERPRWRGRPVHTEEDMLQMNCPYPVDSDL